MPLTYSRGMNVSVSMLLTFNEFQNVHTGDDNNMMRRGGEKNKHRGRMLQSYWILVQCAASYLYIAHNEIIKCFFVLKLDVHESRWEVH